MLIKKHEHFIISDGLLTKIVPINVNMGFICMKDLIYLEISKVEFCLISYMVPRKSTCISLG